MAPDAYQRDRESAGKRHLAHPPDMLDGEAVGAITEQAEHVDADLVKADAVRGEPLGGQPAQPRSLRPADRVQRCAEPGAGAGLHLADDQRVPLDRDDVDLAVGGTPVPVEDPEPAALQVAHRRLLAGPAEHVLRIHRHHLRLRQWRLRTMLSGGDYRLWTKSAGVERLWITWPECQRHLFYYPGDRSRVAGRPYREPLRALLEVSLPGLKNPRHGAALTGGDAEVGLHLDVDLGLDVPGAVC